MGIKIIKKPKSAQGHLEVILSFTLFISALIFLFIFINPFAETEKISIIENIQDKLINNMSLEIGKLSIVLADDSDEINCYNFNPDNYAGNYKEVYENNRKYTIYFGEIFDNIANNKDPSCSSEQYTLGLYSKEKIIIYERIQDLVESYNSDYEALKTRLNIANDFSFSFKNIINEEISELSVSKDVFVGADVEAKEFPVRVINSNGKIQELKLNIKAWR